MEMQKTLAPPRNPSATYPAVPLGFARSALFSASRHDGAERMDRQTVAIMPLLGAELTYSGPKLGQYHAMLWQAVIQAAAEAGAVDGEPFTVAADVLLRAMGGKGCDTQQRERVWGWLKDLTAARLEYSTHAQDYAGPLVFEVARTKPSGQLAIRVNPRLIQLLGNEVLRNDLARKAALGRNLLALWLHDYLATHLRPPADYIETLRKLSGSPLALAQFRPRLRAAMAVLTKGSNPLVVAWSIDQRDRLVVEKAATRVVILRGDVANTKQSGARYQNHKRGEIEQAQQRRARVAL